jgi:hypothetical protein
MNATGVNCKSSDKLFEWTQHKHHSVGDRCLFTGKYQQLVAAIYTEP